MNRYGTESEQAPVFRRRRFSAPHRRRGLWLRLLRPFSAAVIVVGLPLVGGYWVLTTPLLAVDEVAISGGGRVSPDWARRQLEPIRDRSILTLDLAEVESLLSEHPWLRGVEISKQLPSRLEIRLLDRQSVALLKSGQELFYLDQRGRVIAPYDHLSGGTEYVVIAAEAEERAAVPEALALIEEWWATAGSWADGLSEVEVVDATSFRVFCRDLDFPLLVTRDQLSIGLEGLHEYLPRIRDRHPDLAVADLRFSNQIVFQPAARSAQKEG